MFCALGDPEPVTSRLAGGMMRAITISAMTEGLTLSCSNSVNVAIMDLSEVEAGIPVVAAMVLTVMQAGVNYLFPIEGTWQYTFGTRHYSFSDCIRSSWPLTLLGMLLCVTLIPLLSVLFLKIG